MILKTLQRAGNALASPAQQLEVLGDPARIVAGRFQESLDRLGWSDITRTSLKTLQINLGKVCNQTCTHCHVDAGPDRRESMSQETAAQVIDFLSRSQAETLDITGGAPEMNANFRSLVEQATALGKNVIDRCNLTILMANGFTYLPEFLAKHRVNVVASLPCYLEENCDAQRGDGVFVKSIEAIRALNELGYGRPDSGLKLDLVYNPVGIGLPPEQSQLERDYREQLNERYSICFNRLFTITNMPVSRFLHDLLRQEKYEVYMQKLIEAFNPQTIDDLMCRSLVSVDWNGFLYDCDFNQMLDLPLDQHERRLHISELQDSDLVDRKVKTANHCFGCTAGCGSSCTGSLA
ncbi:arsenosugar biosynthesis radical SAM (seleno)protein ArsS [Aureliella helgolandensis]|nr:arsenosugar biosynthesis radical SAM (seleno)protein ArsS [Aureliella helgolandensis]